jgi:uncharacterized protein with HEPN domain
MEHRGLVDFLQDINRLMRSIVGMRDLLVHVYWNTDLNVIWQVPIGNAIVFPEMVIAQTVNSQKA